MVIKWVVLNQIDSNVYFLTLFCEFPSTTLKKCSISTETLSFPEHTFEIGIQADKDIENEGDSSEEDIRNTEKLVIKAEKVRDNQLFFNTFLITGLMALNLIYCWRIALELNLNIAIMTNFVELIHIISQIFALAIFFYGMQIKRAE